MSTTTPYSDQWRAETRARMEALGVDELDVSLATFGCVLELLADGDVSLEIAGAVDAHLAQLEADAEDQALDEQLLAAEMIVITRNGCPVYAPANLERVDVDLGVLCDCDVVQHGSRP